eukprot:671004-Hanusia_phi.AAC.3
MAEELQKRVKEESVRETSKALEEEQGMSERKSMLDAWKTKFVLREQSAARIQGAVKGWRARRELGKRRRRREEEAQVLQAAWRCYRGRKEVEERRRRLQLAAAARRRLLLASRIQKTFRCHRARKMLRQRQEEEEERRRAVVGQAAARIKSASLRRLHQQAYRILMVSLETRAGEEEASRDVEQSRALLEQDAQDQDQEEQGRGGNVNLLIIDSRTQTPRSVASSSSHDEGPASHRLSLSRAGRAEEGEERREEEDKERREEEDKERREEEDKERREEEDKERREEEDKGEGEESERSAGMKGRAGAGVGLAGVMPEPVTLVLDVEFERWAEEAEEAEERLKLTLCDVAPLLSPQEIEIVRVSPGSVVVCFLLHHQLWQEALDALCQDLLRGEQSMMKTRLQAVSMDVPFLLPSVLQRKSEAMEGEPDMLKQEGEHTSDMLKQEGKH